MSLNSTAIFVKAQKGRVHEDQLDDIFQAEEVEKELYDLTNTRTGDVIRLYKIHTYKDDLCIHHRVKFLAAQKRKKAKSLDMRK